MLSPELISEDRFSFEQKMFKEQDGAHVPYDSAEEVLEINIQKQRHIGQEFKIYNADKSDVDTWHFIGGTANGNLVKKETAAGNNTVGSNLKRDAFTLASDGSYDMSAGDIIVAIIVSSASDFSLNIGSTEEGNDIANALQIKGGASEPISTIIYAAASRTIYFSGIIAETDFIILKNTL